MVKTMATAVAEKIEVANNIKETITSKMEGKSRTFWMWAMVPAVLATAGVASVSYLVIRRWSHR